MNYLTHAEFRAAPLVLRSGKRHDHFPHYTILLCLMLAAFALIYGAPPLPGADAEGVVAVFGP